MYKNLLYEMVKQNLTVSKMASELNWNYDTLRNKLSGSSDWWRKEMIALKDKYFSECSLEYLFEKSENKK